MTERYPLDTVYFYSQTDAFAEFSNFAPYGVSMEGLWWATVEHYFQAQKFNDAGYREKIRASHRPRDAKTLGMTRKLPIREDWEEVKVDIMRAAVLQKFRTHPNLAALLEATGDRMIAENAPMEGFWGCGADGVGLNWLGRLLMEARASLRVAARAG